MYRFIDPIVTATFCHEFVRNISAKIAHHWLQSLLLLSNGPELVLHRHDREFKKTCINVIPCSARTISSFCQTMHHLLWCNIHTLWGSSSSVCDGEHFVLKIHKLLLLFDLAFKKYPSCSHPLEKYS